MTKFEDQLFQRLMAEHGHHLHAPRPAAPARRLARRPVWLATGAVGTAAAVTAAVLALGGAPAYAAYSVTQSHGTLTVSVYRASGVAGANTALYRIHVRVVVVPVRPGCPPVSSLPRPHPAPHPSVQVGARFRNGHRVISVKIGKPGIPAGDTMILAFSGESGPGHTMLGAGGIITGRVPRCVSLQSAPPRGTGNSSGPARTTTHGGLRRLG